MLSFQVLSLVIGLPTFLMEISHPSKKCVGVDIASLKTKTANDISILHKKYHLVSSPDLTHYHQDLEIERRGKEQGLGMRRLRHA